LIIGEIGLYLHLGGNYPAAVGESERARFTTAISIESSSAARWTVSTATWTWQQLRSALANYWHESGLWFAAKVSPAAEASLARHLEGLVITAIVI
jgi:hypothetical protein